VGRAHGLRDGAFLDLVADLDDRVASVDGAGFRETPFRRSDELSDRLGFAAAGGVWVKDETGNVSGSHKARHLFGVLLWLNVVERVGLVADGRARELAIASCGNAALAAATVAAADARRLRVFVPVDADPAVVRRLGELGAVVEACERRNGVHGDPTVDALTRAVAAGALPFTCQGNLNGLAIEGGQTLAWEIASSGRELDRVVVQVGGGALASACAHGFREAQALGALSRRPRLDTLQTESAAPLRRAYEAVSVRGFPAGIRYAAGHRREFMWPWETTPHSIAHGILDDETYDWLAVVEGMLATGGVPVVAGEAALAEANAIARDETGIAVDPTGSSGLAGLLELRAAHSVADDERVGVLFTGVDRSASTNKKGAEDAQLSRTRHPVAQGIRAV
jgi:threonine synthase